MTAYEEAAFLADLVTGAPVSRLYRNEIISLNNEALFEEVRGLAVITRRQRLQLAVMLEACRRWREGAGAIMNPLERRYHAYEGLLRHHGLRQHWLLYRRAMREFHGAHRRCLRDLCAANSNFRQKANDA